MALPKHPARGTAADQMQGGKSVSAAQSVSDKKALADAVQKGTKPITDGLNKIGNDLKKTVTGSIGKVTGAITATLSTELGVFADIGAGIAGVTADVAKAIPHLAMIPFLLGKKSPDKIAAAKATAATVDAADATKLSADGMTAAAKSISDLNDSLRVFLSKISMPAKRDEKGRFISSVTGTNKALIRESQGTNKEIQRLVTFFSDDFVDQQDKNKNDIVDAIKEASPKNAKAQPSEKKSSGLNPLLLIGGAIGLLAGIVSGFIGELVRVFKWLMTPVTKLMKWLRENNVISKIRTALGGLWDDIALRAEQLVVWWRESKWIQRVKTAVGGWVDNVIAGIGKVFSMVTAPFKDSKIVTWIVETAKGAWAVIGKAFTWVGKTISFVSEILGKIGSAAGKVWNVISGVGSTIGKAFKFIADMAGKIAELPGFNLMFKVGSKIGKMLGKVFVVLQLVISFFDAISGWGEATKIFGSAATTWQKIESAFAGILSGLTFGLVSTESIAKWIDGIFGGFTTAWDSITNFFVQLWEDPVGMHEKISSWFNNIVTSVSTWFTDIYTWVTTNVASMRESITSSIGGTIQWISDAITGIFSSIMGVIRDIVNPIANIVANTAAGIIDAVKNLADPVTFGKKIVTTLVNTVQGMFFTFFIKPLQTVMQWFGGMVVDIIDLLGDSLPEWAGGKKMKEMSASLKAGLESGLNSGIFATPEFTQEPPQSATAAKAKTSARNVENERAAGSAGSGKTAAPSAIAVNNVNRPINFQMVTGNAVAPTSGYSAASMAGKGSK